MPDCVVKALRIAVVTVALVAAAGAAEVNGPMSSTRKPEPGSAAAASAAASGTSPAAMDVEKVFANTCGWCHSSAGREAGRGPKLMDSPLTDAELIYRIKAGKAGAMPAFASAFNDAEIKAIVKYIRDLKPEGAAR